MSLHRWWSGSGTDEDVSVFVAHGALWSPNQYADLILGGSSEQGKLDVIFEQVRVYMISFSLLERDEYCQSLKREGIDAIANGLVFAVAQKQASSTDSRNSEIVWKGPNQLWQEISMNARQQNGKLVRTSIIEMFSKLVI
jgi:hypothetical protein